MTTIKITALTDIGANIPNTTLIPVVDMTGTPTTDKATFGNVANAILSQAGNNYSAATKAVTVTASAQPNITSVGTLTELSVTGNVTADIYFGDGGFLSNVTGGNAVPGGSNSQVQYNDNGSFSGDPGMTYNEGNSTLTANNFIATSNSYLGNISTTGSASITTLLVGATANLGAVGNVTITGGTNGQVLTTNGTGGLSWTTVSGGGSYSNSNVASYLPTYTGDLGGSNLNAPPTVDFNLNTDDGNGNTSSWTFTADGDLYWPGPDDHSIYNGASNSFVIHGHNNIIISTDGANANYQYQFYANGDLGLPGNVSATVFSGNGSGLSSIAGANVTGTVGNANLSQYLAVSDVNNNFSYHIVLSAGSGDKSLHIDADDNLQYNPADGTLTATRVDATYVLANLNYANGYPAANVTGLGNIATVNLDGNSSNILYGNGVFDSIPNPFNQELNTTDNVTFANITSTDAIRFSNSSNIVGALGYAPNAISIEGYGSNTVNITANDVYSWTFDGNGNLTLPGSLNLTGGHIQQSEDNDLRIVVQDVTDDGYNLDLIVSDGTVDNTLLRIANDEVRIRSNIANSAYDWTFSDQGTFFVAGPISGNYGSNLPIYILNNVGDGVGNVELQVVDYSSNSVLSNVKVGRSNVQIGTLTGTHLWTFDDTGKTTFPTLTVDLHNGGNQTAQTLQFGDDTQQAVITGPTPAANVNAQRLIIQGQRGNGTGEGGDVYVWAGDGDSSAGDIKIYAGDADTSGYGGYINIDGGSGVDGGGQLTLSGGYSSGGQGGQITITPGYSGNGNGALLSLNGGQGSADGGQVNITGGYGGANGGQVNITGGQSALGLPGYGNVQITAGVSTWTFDNTGTLTVPQNINGNGALQLQGLANGNTTINIGSGVGGDIDMVSNLGNINLYTANNQPWIFDQGGNLTAPGAINVGNMVIGTVPGDITADANTGVTFNVSGPDGGFAVNYLDEVGNANTSGGELAFSSETGNATYRISLSDDLGDGFATKIWRFDGTGNLTLPTNSFTVNYANGTPVSIGGGGGNTGNVTFDNVTVQGVNGLNLSAGSDFTANLAYLQVRAGDVASHIHLDTGNNSAYDLILGDDQNYVQVSSTGNILLSAYDSNTSQYTWTLDYNGNLILAGGNSVIQSIANSSLDILNPNVSTMVLTPDPGYSSQALVLDPTSVGHIHLRSPGSNIDQPSANIFLGGETSSFEVGQYNGAVPNLFIHSNNYTWTFDIDGKLTFPGTPRIDTATNNFEVQAAEAINFEANTVVNIYTDAGNTTYQWQFGDDGNLIIPGTGGGFIKTISNASIGIAAMDNGTNNPAQLLSINAGSGAATSIVSAYSTNATIQTNATGTLNTWQFDNAGNLTLPTGGQIIVSGGLVSSGASPAPTINGFSITNSVGISGNGNIAGGNISATGNVSGNFFLGNGSQLTGITVTSLVNGTSNVVVASSGNVTVGVAGSANVITATSTGANVTGTLNATGDVTAQGTGSNIVRRAFGLVAADTYVQLDDLKARVTSSTSQLSLILDSGTWQGTGWTETFAGGGTPSVNNWVNLPLSSGFDNASGAMPSQGNGCRCIISDQTPSAKVYQITVVRSGTTGSQWNISIERLV